MAAKLLGLLGAVLPSLAAADRAGNSHSLGKGQVMVNRVLAAAVVGVMCCSSLSFAQSSDMKAMAQQFGASAKQNAAALKMYTWKMRVTLTLKGEAKPPKVFQMAWGPDGKIQKTSLTQDAPAQKSRGLRGRIVEKKTAEMKDYVADVAEVCKDYLAPSPELLQAFFSRVITAQAPGGWMQLSATDVLARGDKLVYEIDPKTQAINRVLFTAAIEDDPVEGAVQMSVVPGGGPGYAAKATIAAPAKKLTATIENYDYARVK